MDAKRGHTAQEVVEAVTRLKQRGMTVGVQLLPGLKGETWHTILETAIAVVKLKPDFVRIYPVLVIENTELADQYRAGEYEPLSTEQAITFCAFLKAWFNEHNIEVIRTGLQSTEELDSGNSLVAGPYEPAMGELVVNEQYKQSIERCINEHLEYFVDKELSQWNVWGRLNTFTDLNISIFYPRSLTSKVRGLKNRNIVYFQAKYPYLNMNWYEDSTRNTVRCCIDGLQYVL